jgi:hypothetical protein
MTSTVSRRRRTTNLLAAAGMTIALLLAVIPLVAVVSYLVTRGGGIISWSFLTEKIPAPRKIGPGVGPAVVGTILITGAASLMAIPLGILGGIYLNEYGGRSVLARFIRFLSEVMTGVPSIVMGLFIYTLVVLNTGQRTGFAGALALAFGLLLETRLVGGVDVGRREVDVGRHVDDVSGGLDERGHGSVLGGHAACRRAKNAVTRRAAMVATNTITMRVSAAPHARSCCTEKGDVALVKIWTESAVF